MTKYHPTRRHLSSTFSRARHRLLTESERIAQESAIDRQIQEPAIRRERSVGLVDALEEAFYWLILAAALAYLALGIFGLSNFSLRARTPAVDAANYQAATTGAGQSLSQTERLTVNEQIAGPSVNPSGDSFIQDPMPLLTN
jgi:hypothetical protein